MADDIESLISESRLLRKGLLETARQLDDFIEQLACEIKELRKALPPDKGDNP
jgi:hypothetical protein